MFSRIVYGCQVTALVGLGTVILVAALSLTVGVASGYFGGKVDFIVQRLVDIWLSFPAIFLILTLVAVLQSGSGGGFFGLGRGPEMGPNPSNGDWFWYTFPRTTIVILTLGVVLAGGASRVVRSAVLATKANPYVEAAVVVGANNWRIISRHILPNILPVVIVLATLQLGAAILAEATISFLGVGVTNFPTWGQMLSGRTRDLAESHFHLWLVPGLAIFFAVFGFNMLGDALRDVLDPRLRGTR
jgi:peptide/nickel transport system permease protein